MPIMKLIEQSLEPMILFKRERDMDCAGLLTLYGYNAYATGLLLDIVKQLSPAEMDRHTSPSHNSVRQLLRHMLATETYYLHASKQQEYQPITSTELADMRARWQQLQREAQEFIHGCSEEDLQRVLPIQLMKKTYHFPIHQLLVQPVIHSIHHRGELSIVLTELGHPLPTLDIIVQLAEESGQHWDI